MLPAVLLLAAAIGLAVGLLGGGGSVLAVPLLVFGLGMAPAAAVTTSLLVVAVTAVAAAVPHARAGRVRWGIGLAFGPAGIAGAYLGGALGAGLPDAAVMTLFGATLALSAAVTLLRRPAPTRSAGAPVLPRIVLVGVGIGLITGLVGVGGGFLIVPALIYLIGLPVHAAIGTSLVVIAINATAGVAGRLGRVDIDWGLALALAAVAAAGAVLGGRLTGRVAAEPLRIGFGLLVIAIGALVLIGQVL